MRHQATISTFTALHSDSLALIKPYVETQLLVQETRRGMPGRKNGREEQPEWLVAWWDSWMMGDGKEWWRQSSGGIHQHCWTADFNLPDIWHPFASQLGKSTRDRGQGIICKMLIFAIFITAMELGLSQREGSLSPNSFTTSKLKIKSLHFQLFFYTTVQKDA